MNEWVIFLISSLVIAVGYLIGYLLNKKTKLIQKISSWIIVPFPFILFLIIGIPIVLTKVHVDYLFWCAGLPFLFFLGVMVPIFMDRWIAWRQRKRDAAKKAGYPQHNKNKEVKKHEKRGKK